MKINRGRWMNDQDLVEKWLDSSYYGEESRGIEDQIRNMRRNMAIILLELNKDKVLEICEDKS